MKRLIIFTFMLLAAASVMAQVIVPVPTDPDVPSLIVSLIPVKYQAITMVVLTVLFILSEILGSLKSVQANGTIQLVFGWIKKLFTASKAKK